MDSTGQFKKGQTMDGQETRTPPGFFRSLPLLLTVTMAGIALPGVLHAQAMGKAQVEASALPQIMPLGYNTPLAATSGVSPDLVALASDVKKAKSVDVSTPKAAQPDVTGSAAVKSPAPLVDLAPATQPAPPPTAAPVPAVTPHNDTIESALIRPSGKASTLTLATPGSTTTPPAASGESSLYGRFLTVAQVGGALAVVLGLIFIGRALVRKYVPGAALGSGKGVMEILARYPLAKNQSLVLVRIGSQLVVLNQTRDSSQSVLVIHDQIEVAKILGQIQGAKPNSIQQGFSNLLANARMDLESTPPDAPEATIELGDLDSQLDEMAAARRQLMELRQQVRSVRESMPV